jgi:hypothetical protein
MDKPGLSEGERNALMNIVQAERRALIKRSLVCDHFITSVSQSCRTRSRRSKEWVSPLRS